MSLIKRKQIFLIWRLPLVKPVHLKQEPCPELELAGIADARDESNGLFEHRTKRIAVVVLTEIGRIEQVEELGKHPEPAALPEREELRYPQVQKPRRVAPLRVHGHLMAGRWIHVAIIVRPVPVQVDARRQGVRAGAGRLEDGRELDTVRQLEHAKRHDAVALV